MKHFFTLLFTSCLFAGFGNTELKPSQTLKKQLITNYEQLIEKTTQLAAIGNTDKIDWEKATKAFFEARISYKEIELFLAYLDHEFIKDHINGAPLPHIERKAPDLVIFDPAGFQITEEVLMEQESQAFRELTKQLNSKVKEFQKYIPPARISERMVFEAMREELIRLAAMGITGFDTPSTLNALNESKTVVGALHNTILAYENYINSKDIQEFNALFTQGNTFFENTDFDTFNRFGFIREFVNPVYKKLLEIQKSLYIETKDLVFSSEFSVNYEATNIFDTDFLNYAYFSRYTNSGNKKEREELGKLLFFDPLMSNNNQRACASCHHPDKAFADGLKTSPAFDGEGVLDRNSPGLINSVFNTRFFWDARATTPEEQIEHVLFNPKEFNSNYDEVSEKIKSCEEYLERFDKAYPETENYRIKQINRYTIVASISAYIQSLRSFDSPFDKAIRTGSNTTDNEKIVNGFNIFSGKAKCATCHFIPTFAGNVPPLYTDTETEVLGVPAGNNQEDALLDFDKGRYSNGRPKEKAPFYMHSFKTPTLRNIALTGPYMHNGVFGTLREVVDFYNIGGGHGWGIAPENTTLPSDSLHLTEEEINDLIFFMEALTDTTGLTSNPVSLPKSNQAELNERKVGGLY